ncbi:MAG: DNA cytosine methyltransferase [Paludibacteraceae bacterium]|nr:DNA cytosine methyltransferase [Paludibacteraceae bacterium]
MIMRQLLYIDLFCGAGGTSTGVERAMYEGNKCAEVIACVNHDPNAIASHAANHPNALHFTEDIRTLDLTELVAHTNSKRAANPNALVVLWASLECTNFSKAKGGQPRDADSRTLAEHLFRYIEALTLDYIYIENVEEFMCWGDLDENGKPVSRDKGRLYMRWVQTVCKYGYDFAYRLLNAANYGAYTSRTRFFGIFAKKNLPIVFPEPTHCKNGKRDMFSSLQSWKPVKEVLELSNEGKSIFERDKPLADKTLERIYAGLIKFVAGGKEAFLIKYNSMNQSGKYTAPSIDEPCPTVATQNRLGVAKVQFLSKQFSGDPNGKNISINEPCGTITTIDHHAVVSTQFIDAYYGNGHEHSIELPSPTLTTVDRLSLITADQFILNPQYSSSGGSIDKPCFTLIARMDKMPPYLVSAEKGKFSIVVYESDTPAMRKIKEFMAMFGIVDIKMRMLNVGELKRIMGFGSEYTLIGTQAEQKKYIGNAVEVNMSRALCVALYSELNQLTKH